MIKSLALLAALSVPSCTPAMASDGTWYQGEHWTVEVVLAEKTCVAIAKYDNGHALLFATNGSTLSFGIAGLGLDDDTYTTKIKTDKSDLMGLIGKSTNGLLTFHNINNKAEVAIKDGNILYVDGVGSYRLNESRKALDEVVTCALTLQDTI